jgi:hypothetical protein
MVCALWGGHVIDDLPFHPLLLYIHLLSSLALARYHIMGILWSIVWGEWGDSLYILNIPHRLAPNLWVRR